MTNCRFSPRSCHADKGLSRGPTTNCADLLLFAAVPDRAMLEQGFYAAEAEGLRRHPLVRSVTITNDLAEVRHATVDGIISYFYSHSAAVAAIAKIKGVPVIATGGGEQVFRDSSTPAPTFALRLAAFHACTLLLDRILATSTSDFERMRKLVLFRRNCIKLSFHGVAAVEAASPAHFTYQRAPSSLVTIAGLDTELNVRRKGVLEAVDLLARFSSRDSSASLTIIGRTTCREMVAAYALRRNVRDRLHFAGYVTEKEKIDLLHRSRFYVQLSEYEGFGIGALEALAHGCQVIHTNVGGLRDTVGDYGIVVSRDAVNSIDPGRFPAYGIPEWSRFQTHLSQFNRVHRAETIVRALGFSPS